MKRAIRWFLIGCAISACLFLCGCNPATATVVGEIETILLGIIPIAAGAAAVLLPGESAAITAGATLAANAVKAVQKVVADYHSNPSDTALAKVTAAMNDAHDNLAQLLAAAQVKDPTTAQKITGIVNAATASLAAVEATLNANHDATVAAVVPPAGD